jgi:hypothetical protein
MLDDVALAKTLMILGNKLLPGGRLVLRAVLPGERRTWLRLWEELRLWREGVAWHYRSSTEVAALIAAAGFTLRTVEAAAPGGEVVWFVAERPGHPEGAPQEGGPP